MHDCKYCGESFDEEVELHRHWLAEHEDELSGHKKDTAKRTVNRQEEQKKSYRQNERQAYKTVGLLVVGLLIIVVGGYALIQSDVVSFTAEQPTSSTGDVLGAPGSAHYHTPFELTVDGQRVDFSQPQYQYSQTREQRAHFEAGDGSTLHYHATGVPLSYVFETFGWTFNANETTVLGETYSPEEVTVSVDGEEVEEPWNYVADDGERISIRIESQDG